MAPPHLLCALLPPSPHPPWKSHLLAALLDTASCPQPLALVAADTASWGPMLLPGCWRGPVGFSKLLLPSPCSAPGACLLLNRWSPFRLMALSSLFPQPGMFFLLPLDLPVSASALSPRGLPGMWGHSCVIARAWPSPPACSPQVLSPAHLATVSSHPSTQGRADTGRWVGREHPGTGPQTPIPADWVPDHHGYPPARDPP